MLAQHIGDAAQRRGRMSGTTRRLLSLDVHVLAGARPRATDLCGTVVSAAWFVPQGGKKSFYTSSMIVSKAYENLGEVPLKKNLGEVSGGK